MRPVAGVIDLALEILHAPEFGRAGVRQTTRREYDMLRDGGLTIGSRYRPSIGALIEYRGFHRRIKLDVLPQIVAIGDMAGIAQDFGLRRIALAPVPFL